VKRAFRLATVERLRSSDLSDAAHGLARARQQVGVAVAARDGVVRALDGCVAGRTTSTAELEAAQARRVVLREQVEEAVADLATAREQAAAALSAWSTARARLRAVETLHERHREALREDDDRRAQRELDDFAGTRRRRLGGEAP
jgi:flagellar export protein FliJ